MRVSVVSALIVATCFLAWMDSSEAVCCTVKGYLKYRIEGGDCGAVGGRRTKDGCSITICGNGRALVGTFCGRGSCNIFGCACKGGCLGGDYAIDFIKNNPRYKIHVTSAVYK
ncbi:hypothetical protein KR074_006953 [Drosophila pseudoananassae]|nr:hypothetical protein KR074_006953 [Drosophila pseudoananassae]